MADFSEQVSNIVEKCSKVVCVALVTVMVCVVLYGVFMRYVIQSAVAWVEEAPIYMMIWTSFIAGSVGIKYGIHVGVDSLVRHFPPKTILGVRIGVNVLIIVFAIILVIEGWIMAAYAFKYQQSISLGISMGWAIMAVPVGAMLMIIELCHSIFVNMDKLLNGPA